MQAPTLTYTALEKHQADYNHVTSAPVIILLTLAGFVLSYILAPKGPLSLIPIGVVVLGVVLTVVRLRRDITRRVAALSEFAHANDLGYHEEINNPDYSGMFFSHGYDKKITDSFILDLNGKPLEIGNYRYTIGTGKNKSTFTIGYVRSKLPRTLPNMLLDSRANNVLRSASVNNFPTQLASSQTLQLEGNFNEHFTLYVPKKYERDALYVFTPDVMATLIDHARELDVEISGDDLYFYNSRPFILTDPATWKNILAVMSAVSPELEAQTDYYADEKVANRQLNQVAEPGKRLKSGFNKTTLWFVGGFVALYAFTTLTNALPPEYSGLFFIFGGALFWGSIFYLFYRGKKQPPTR